MADDTRVTHSRLGLACAVVLLCALGWVLPAVSQASDIIVSRESGLSASERADVRVQAGGRHERNLPVADAEVVSVPAAHAGEALAALSADPHVRSAVPDIAVHATGTAPQGDTMSYALTAVDALGAWETSFQGQTVTVGVADMQVDADHPDLKHNVEAGPDFVPPKDACKTPAPPRGRGDYRPHVPRPIP